MNEPLLFLAHRLPFPPTKGDKVRSHHLLLHLARRYRVFLGTFVDDPADWPYAEQARAHCAEVHLEGLARGTRRWRSLEALVTGEALALPYFRSRGLKHWVTEVVRRERIERAIAFSSPMAQYLLDVPGLRSIVDFVDLDSAKWADYATRRAWPVSALYALEARRLSAFERTIAERVEASVFVTREEARLLADAVPQCANRIVAIENGVDRDYFSPSHEFDSPFEASEHAIVFTGAMDYWPNIDAVSWFAREVLPRVRERNAEATFYIVGMNPDHVVQALARASGVRVTGRVPDVRPYLKHARVVVAPLRVARGIQNKVLEAMAMGRPTVVTGGVARALSARPGIDFELADEPDVFAEKVLAAIEPSNGEAMGRRARARIEADYAWSTHLAAFDDLLGAHATPRIAAVAPSLPSTRPATLGAR